MADEHVVVKDWTTKSGLRAVILRLRLGTEQWHCGYVAVPKTHPLHGVEYNTETPVLEDLRRVVEQGKIGDRGIMTVFAIALRDGMSNRPEDVFDVHGSLTFSAGDPDYPVKSTDLWWFGFDCHHCDDTIEVCNEAYAVEQCEQLAAQLAQVKSVEPK